MELFKSEVLKKEYKEFTNELLPKVLECSYCNVMPCKHHSKFKMQCSLCRKAMYRNCRSFNLSRDILLGGANQETRNYLNNDIVDFLDLSDESLKHYFPDIKLETIRREKPQFKKRVKSKKNRSQLVNQVLPSQICSGHFQHGRFKRKFYY